MPESSAWQDMRTRWELQNNNVEADLHVEIQEDFEDEVVVHNELYVSENEEEEIEEEEIIYGQNGSTTGDIEAFEGYESSDERQSHISGISQQDRDNKTILLRQAASGNYTYDSDAFP